MSAFMHIHACTHIMHARVTCRRRPPRGRRMACERRGGAGSLPSGGEGRWGMQCSTFNNHVFINSICSCSGSTIYPIGDVGKYGGTPECGTCTMMFMGERGARPPHTDACRARFEELWANDQDPEAESKAEAQTTVAARNGQVKQVRSPLGFLFES